MKRIAICWLFACSASSGSEPAPEEIAATNAALDHWTKVAQETTPRLPEEIIWELGRQIRMLARDDIYPGPRRIEVYQLIQKKLISIPGHADYFGSKLRKDRELFAAGREHKIQGGRSWDFETLGQLPSHETVRVLGSFLNDGPIEDIPDPAYESSDLAKPMEDNLLAARALHELKIVGPPLQKRPGCYADVHPWRLWFSQVQAGTRTYRFQGDPHIYGLSGPVSEAEAQRLANIAIGTTEGAPTTSVDPSAIIKGDSQSRIVPLVASCLLLAIAVWFGTMRRQTGRPD